MNCEELTQLLPDLVDGTLPLDIRTEAEAALLECPDCQRDLNIAREIRTILITIQSQQPALQVSAGFEARLLARVRSQQANLDILDLSSQAFAAWIVELINLIGGLINTSSTISSVPQTSRA